MKTLPVKSELTRKSLIGSMVRDAQLEFQREEYPRAGGKQESIRTAQTLLPAINLTYCITGLSLRIGASEQHYKSSRMIKVCHCLNVYNSVLKGASKLNTSRGTTKGRHDIFGNTLSSELIMDYY